MSMAERTIFKTIKDGLQVFIDDPRRFERFLIDNLELSEKEAANARVLFAGGTNERGETVDAKPPNLVHGYARTGGPFPCWALTLSNESTVQDYLDQDALVGTEDGRLVDPETGRIVDPKQRRVRYTHNLMVIGDNPDVVLYYYHLAKFILLREQDALEAKDLDDLSISGADLAPDSRYLPANMFARVLTITVDTDECWTEDSGDRGDKVGGIHVDSGDGTSGNVGTVNAGVTTAQTGS